MTADAGEPGDAGRRSAARRSVPRPIAGLVPTGRRRVTRATASPATARAATAPSRRTAMCTLASPCRGRRATSASSRSSTSGGRRRCSSASVAFASRTIRRARRARQGVLQPQPWRGVQLLGEYTGIDPFVCQTASSRARSPPNRSRVTNIDGEQCRRARRSWRSSGPSAARRSDSSARCWRARRPRGRAVDRARADARAWHRAARRHRQLRPLLGRRHYNAYHWLDAARETIGFYFNICDR